MNPDYDTWNYWFAFWTNDDKTKLNYTISRTPETIDMVSMMKKIVEKKPKMDFNPTLMFMGRLLDNKTGRQYYDNDQYQLAMDAILSNDTTVVADVCIVKLVEAKSREEFNKYKLHYNTFDQLDDLIASQRKKSRS